MSLVTVASYFKLIQKRFLPAGLMAQTSTSIRAESNINSTQHVAGTPLWAGETYIRNSALLDANRFQKFGRHMNKV